MGKKLFVAIYSDFDYSKKIAEYSLKNVLDRVKEKADRFEDRWRVMEFDFSGTEIDLIEENFGDMINHGYYLIHKNDSELDRVIFKEQKPL